MRRPPTNEEVLEKFNKILKRWRPPGLGRCEVCKGLMIKWRPGDRRHTECGRRVTSYKAGRRRTRRMRLSQVNVGCTILERFPDDEGGTWQEQAIEKLIEKADEEAEERGDEAEANKLEVSRSAARKFVRDLVKLGNAGINSPEAQRMIDRCSLAEDSEQRHLATIAVTRFCALFKKKTR